MNSESTLEMFHSDFPLNDEWLSTCCGAPCLGHMEVAQDGKTAEGICNDCHDHAGFERDEED